MNAKQQAAYRAIDAFLRACPEVQLATFQQMARRQHIPVHRMIAGWIAEGTKRYAAEQGAS